MTKETAQNRAAGAVKSGASSRVKLSCIVKAKLSDSFGESLGWRLFRNCLGGLLLVSGRSFQDLIRVRDKAKQPPALLTAGFTEGDVHWG